MRILILGGTGEGRELAAELAGLPGLRVISSLAGRVSSPRLPAGSVRVGGFGGVPGLTEYLRAEGISAVVDATHPFAAQMTANAAAACQALNVPLLILRRPGWEAGPGDRWTPVPDISAAAALIASRAPETRILLTTGRQETAAFAPLPQHFWLRAVETPDGPLPARCEIILDRGPFDLAAELALLRASRIDLLVTKNSGGAMTAAKLAAARELGIEVVMVERPGLPPGIPTVADVGSAVASVAVTLQNDLRSRVDLSTGLPHPPKYVAGVDVSYETGTNRGAAAAVLMALPTLEIVDSAVVLGEATFPYLPGLLAFREMPLVLQALEQLTIRPDVIVCDGYGIAHPRRFGLACHLGLETQIPTFGVAKTAFVAEFADPAAERGNWSALMDGDEVLGRALRTRSGIKPVFVSVGHRIQLDEATRLTLALSPRHRIPEPIRQADQISRRALKKT